MTTFHGPTLNDVTTPYQFNTWDDVTPDQDGFGGLVVTCWPLAPKFAGSNPAKAVEFFGRKNPQHAFLRRGSKRIFPMSQLCGM